MNTLIPLGLFLVVQVMIQHHERKAQRLLSNDDKVKLLDGSSGFYFLQMLPTLVLLFAFAGFMFLKPSIPVMSAGLIVYIVLVGVSSLISQRMMTKKLSTFGLPDSYVKHRGRSALIQSAAMIVFLSWILGSTLWTFRKLTH